MATAGISARLSLNSSQFTAGLSNASRSAHEAVSRLNQKFGQFQQVTTKGAAVAAGIFAAQQISNTVAKYEKLNRQLIAISGGAEGAALQMQRLKELVVDTPGLGLEGAVDGLTRLKTMGYTAKQAEENIKALANVTAMFGGGEEEMKGVILAFSQISTKTSLMAEEINQLAERLPTVRSDLEALFGSANPDELRAKGIGSTQVIDALLERWKMLTPLASGYNEELKKISLTWEQIQLQFGPAFISTLSAINRTIASAVAAHKIAGFGMMGLVDSLFGTNTGELYDIEQENAKEKAQMQIDATDALNQEKKRAKVLNDIEAAKKAFREQNGPDRIKMLNERDALLSGIRQDLSKDDPQVGIDMIDAELAKMTDKSQMISDISRKIEEGKNLTAEELDYHNRINELFKERDALQERINAKTRAEFNKRVEEEMMTPSERKAAMRKRFDEKRAQKNVMRDMERDLLNEEEKRERNRNLDRIKNNEGAWDKDKARQRAREKVAEDLKNAFRDNNVILTSIEQILKTLATA
jgi:tape measure domain-containing protein